MDNVKRVLKGSFPVLRGPFLCPRTAGFLPLYLAAGVFVAREVVAFLALRFEAEALFVRGLRGALGSAVRVMVRVAVRVLVARGVRALGVVVRDALDTRPSLFVREVVGLRGVLGAGVRAECGGIPSFDFILIVYFEFGHIVCIGCGCTWGLANQNMAHVL
jgi:hypothetical protein